LNSYWTDAEIGKNKGSGIGAIVSEKWAKHIGQVKKHNGYLLELHFFFRQLEIVVFIVYIASNSQQIRKETQRTIMREIAKRKLNMHFIVMGDFNHIIQASIDRGNSNNTSFKKLPLHSWLMKQGFVDTFREKYPNKKEFSWSNGRECTRIDQIWVSDSLNLGLKEAYIEEMSIDTGSDHSLVATELTLEHLEIKSSLAQIKRKGEKRTIFLYDKATKENWDNYRNKLQYLLRKRVSEELWHYDTQENAVETLDQEWDNISRSIKQAAEEEIPRKKVLNSGCNKAPKKVYTELQIAVNLIRKLVKRCKKEKGTSRTEKEQIELEEQIEKVNRNTESSIDIQGIVWSEQLQEELIRWWAIIKNKLVAENCTEVRLEIRECIDRRCEMIKNNQRRMINSLLEKPFKKVVIDRLLVEEEGNKELLNEPVEVLEKTADHFRKQFKKRNFQEEDFTSEWKSIYNPIARIQASWYEDLNSEVTEEE
jgi:exonuclease III